MKIVDLFAGCGGLSKGFQDAGFNIVAAFDNWEPAINVYRKNFLHPILMSDLSNYEVNIAQVTLYNPTMIIGGPPCQDFSSAGKRDESLGRADLTIEFAKFVTAVQPVWFVMENVSQIVTSQAFSKAYNLFKLAGYGLTQKVLDASLCGVPQVRKRLFLIGHLNDIDNALEPYLTANLSKTPLNVRKYLHQVGLEWNIEHYYRHPRSYARRAVFSIDEPSATIRGVNRPVPPTYKRHVGDTMGVSPTLRPLTTKERSIIQTFPLDFVFEGTKADVEQMLGNAVPVKLAEFVANCIQQYIAASLNPALEIQPEQPLLQLSLF
jgi:DNA (cytosine-5)-methyltransferase 1